MRCVVFGVPRYKPKSTPESPCIYAFANGKRTTKKAIVFVALAIVVAVII
jgi:hypothetical protein